ncbi:B3/B4 domain-containing protein [Salinispora vitiensis]|uniref:B3/B4 domain-containing protein n=1 Tax=Salinispora vitiensis TaxID=999544 RepID=UPI000382E3DF|nr:phenylalanine--tRNA ligase beta subunit-related protein [Salinispora vitiensis]
MALSFGLDDAVLADFPESQVRLVLADGVRNDGSWPLTDRLIDELTADLAAGRWQPHDESQPTIASWHEAYRRFGTNPRRTRPSVDALSRRLAKVGRLPRVNPVVDAYNLVSVRHGIPAGAFDVASIDEPVVVRPAQPGDGFTPLNETDRREEPAPGEVVYTAGSEVLTRHWNHRDCDRCKVTPATRRVVFILERVSASAVPDEAMTAAQDLLVELVNPHAERITVLALSADLPRTETVSV